jgi:hypothetical protein
MGPHILLEPVQPETDKHKGGDRPYQQVRGAGREAAQIVNQHRHKKRRKKTRDYVRDMHSHSLVAILVQRGQLLRNIFFKHRIHLEVIIEHRNGKVNRGQKPEVRGQKKINIQIIEKTVDNRGNFG